MMSLVLLLVAALAMYVSVGDATPMACHNSGCGDCGAHAPAAACPPALSASLVAAANAAAAALAQTPAAKGAAPPPK